LENHKERKQIKRQAREEGGDVELFKERKRNGTGRLMGGDENTQERSHPQVGGRQGRDTAAITNKKNTTREPGQGNGRRPSREERKKQDRWSQRDVSKIKKPEKRKGGPGRSKKNSTPPVGKRAGGKRNPERPILKDADEETLIKAVRDEKEKGKNKREKKQHSALAEVRGEENALTEDGEKGKKGDETKEKRMKEKTETGGDKTGFLDGREEQRKKGKTVSRPSESRKRRKHKTQEEKTRRNRESRSWPCEKLARRGQKKKGEPEHLRSE